MKDDLADRSVTSVKWNVISNIVHIVINLTQSIVLARLLPIETFGIVAGAASIIGITSGLSNFGMRGAFNYRSQETEDLENAAEVHFSLQIIINLLWTVLMLIGGFLFIKETTDGFRLAFIVLTLAEAAATFCNTPNFMLVRLVKHKRLAIISIADTIITLIVGVTLAIIKQPLWSLLSSYLVTAAVNIFLLYIWRPIWKPKFKWSISTIKYFLIFGSKQVVAAFLMDALEKVDDLWTKIFLGSVSLGYYSKAYSFALYPGQILASPINKVAIGTYSEVANDRKKLSNAFFQSNALLIRTGFFLVGLLFLVAPEFIRILLGEKWMPMLIAFRLMLPYTLFDPMKKTMANLFVAVGKPEIIVRIRTTQLVVMIAGLFILGKLLGIEGVALAVDIMMLVGLGQILWRSKDYVDFPLKKAFGVPFLAFLFGAAAGYSIDYFISPGLSDIVSGLTKIILFTGIYVGTFFLLDRKDLITYYRMAKRLLFRRAVNDPTLN